VHWRRGDFIGYCFASVKSDACTYVPKQAASCTVRHARKHGLREIFLATNADPEEVSLPLLPPLSIFPSLPPATSAELSTERGEAAALTREPVCWLLCLRDCAPQSTSLLLLLFLDPHFTVCAS